MIKRHRIKAMLTLFQMVMMILSLSKERKRNILLENRQHRIMPERDESSFFNECGKKYHVIQFFR